MSTSAMQDGHN